MTKVRLPRRGGLSSIPFEPWSGLYVSENTTHPATVTNSRAARQQAVTDCLVSTNNMVLYLRELPSSLDTEPLAFGPTLAIFLKRRRFLVYGVRHLGNVST